MTPTDPIPRAVAVILAAGHGTRMRSDIPKVLHEIDGRPMVRYVIDAVHEAGFLRVVVVIGYEGERVRDACDGTGVEYAWQHEQLGTGHAVQQAEPFVDDSVGTVVVLNGDVPGLRAATLQGLVGYHRAKSASATVLTARLADPMGYGRIVRNESGALLRIVEHRDADEATRRINEINSGMFCFESKALFPSLRRAGRDNTQGEYYLTDVIELLRSEGRGVEAWCIPDAREVAGVNTEEELHAVRDYLRGLS